jgi:tRNA(Ile)-lysidine synthase
MGRPKKSLESRVLAFIQECCLLPARSRLLVAVSGGPDSVCLLHLLLKLREELDLSLHVAHLDHQLRGAESAADARYVAELTRTLDLPATIERRDVKSYQAEKRLSLEEAAREVRYDFLAQVARKVGVSRLATGHTRDDNIETILMHLIRGSGTNGLRGLEPLTGYPTPEGKLSVVRPLLDVSREETADYCQEHNLMPRLDSSNLSLSPLRNRLRLKLLPQLKSYNPAIADALLRTSRIAADDIAFIEQAAGNIWPEVARTEAGTLILDKARFLELPPALKRQTLRIVLEKLSGNPQDIEARHIEGMMAALDKPAGRSLNLPSGLKFVIEYDRYLLGQDPAVLSPFPPLEGELPLSIPGRTVLPGWQVEASIADREPPAETGDALTACFDRNKTGDRLFIRSRKRGDRFQPLGMSQTKKLNEFMIDRKIPRLWRQRIPVVCSPEQIIWVVGARIDNRVKVTDDTRQVLRLKFRPA